MRLLSLHIEHFKNYDRLSVDLSKQKVLILVGKNGHGKTNFLESMVYLALSKSYYSSTGADLVNWSFSEDQTGLPEYFRIRGTYQSSCGESVDLEVGAGRSKRMAKMLKVNGVKVKAPEYIGHLKVVLFTPQDLNMVFLAPQLRRRYINIFISQTDGEYLQHLSRYQLVLRHRNKLLSELRDQPSRVSELDYWDEQLSLHGSYLLWKRREIFSRFNEHLSKHYERISEQPVDFRLTWKKDWESEALEDYASAFARYLAEKRNRDIDASNTCGGPHREDFEFLMNGKNLAEFGSRGECRSAILALKLAEAGYITSTSGDSPLVLFDDVFSELDPDRQRNLLRLFQVDQVFITTTHLDFTEKDTTVWEIEKGTIVPTTSAS